MASDRTVSRLSRILALVPFLVERGAVPVDEVLHRFDYTLDELSRDLNTLIVCGLPGYMPDDLMWAYIDEEDVVMEAADYFSQAPKFTPTEGLGLLAAGLTALEMGETSPDLRSAVTKLAGVLLPESDDVLSVHVLDETVNVGALKAAATNRKVVRFTYRSLGREAITTREVEPWSVFHTIGQWYVVGHCRMVDGQRTFRVDRILDMETLDEEFSRPDSVPEPEIGYTPSEGDVSCVIDLTPAASWVPDYYPVEHLSVDNTHTRVRFWAPDPETPARLLLRLGATASLVEGDEVRERLSELGSSLLSRYT